MFLLIVSLYIYFAVLRPFDKLKGFAENIAQGNFDVPLKYERSNYFGKFTWAFDSMRNEITKSRQCEKEAVENNKTVIATLSHDIKTPIRMCCVQKPESIIMSEGRYPQYDNEIAVTDFLAKELNLKTGDKVTVSSKNIAAEYIITGIHVYAANSGLTFAMPLEGAKKLDVQDVLFYGFSLKDTSECFDITDELNEKYSDILTAVGVEEDPNLAMYSVARGAMTAIIYIISVLFSLIVVLMVCKKAFLQEKRDIGIYKALGFTSSKLRLQFAVRFLIVSLIGSAFGSLLSVLFTQNVLTAVFSFAGISSFNTEFTAVSFIVPVAIIAVSFFVFSYLASSKIKTVEIKDLVVE